LAHPPRRDGQPEDEDLVRAVLAGDEAAQMAIWRRYVPLVRAKLRRSIGGQDVEDLVQEVFLRLFEYLPQLRDPAALRSFLIGITLRIAGSELRRRRCRWWLTLSATGELPEPCTFEDEGEKRQVVSKLLGILGQLTPVSYRFFELRFMEERELAEVADTMNVSLATAKRHLARVSARVYAMADRLLRDHPSPPETHRL
jgi:RNA polymerase sigma-70 factor (ECF subfamily)